MDIPVWLYKTVACVVITALTALTCCMVSKEKIRPGTFLKVFGILGGMLTINMFILPNDSPFRMVFAVIGALLCYYFVYGMRGRKLILFSFLLMLIEFSGDIASGMVFFRLFDSDAIAAMRYMTSPTTVLLQAACGSVMVLFGCLYRLLDALYSKRRSHSKAASQVGYLLRPVGMLGIICFIFAKTLYSTTQTDQVARFLQILPDLIIMTLLLLIGVSYVLQDIRSYQQSQENKTLLHQQSLQSLLLHDTRVFRHNISNLLYGFQGTLLSGDLTAIRQYYDHMTASLQMINNENVVALKRLPSQAVSTLLLNKIRQAGEEKIPFYATVSEDIRWFGLRDEEMAQVLGVLVDNAVEAARSATAPFVSFEARNNEENALCIVIRNTYNPETTPSFGPTTKQGHDGLGLVSVRSIVKKHGNVLFNIYVRGRYVEASLVCY